MLDWLPLQEVLVSTAVAIVAILGAALRATLAEWLLASRLRRLEAALSRAAGSALVDMQQGAPATRLHAAEDAVHNMAYYARQNLGQTISKLGVPPGLLEEMAKGELGKLLAQVPGVQTPRPPQ